MKCLQVFRNFLEGSIYLDILNILHYMYSGHLIYIFMLQVLYFVYLYALVFNSNKSLNKKNIYYIVGPLPPPHIIWIGSIC